MVPYSQAVFTLWLITIWRWTGISQGVWDSCLHSPSWSLAEEEFWDMRIPEVPSYATMWIAWPHIPFSTYHAPFMMEWPSWYDSVYLWASSVFSALPHKLKMMFLNKGYVKEVPWATDIWMQFFSSTLIHGNYPSGIKKKYDRQRINKFGWELSLHGLHSSFSQLK